MEKVKADVEDCVAAVVALNEGIANLTTTSNQKFKLKEPVRFGVLGGVAVSVVGSPGATRHAQIAMWWSTTADTSRAASAMAYNRDTRDVDMEIDHFKPEDLFHDIRMVGRSEKAPDPVFHEVDKHDTLLPVSLERALRGVLDGRADQDCHFIRPKNETGTAKYRVAPVGFDVRRPQDSQLLDFVKRDDMWMIETVKVPSMAGVVRVPLFRPPILFLLKLRAFGDDRVMGAKHLLDLHLLMRVRNQLNLDAASFMGLGRATTGWQAALKASQALVDPSKIKDHAFLAAEAEVARTGLKEGQDKAGVVAELKVEWEARLKDIAELMDAANH